MTSRKLHFTQAKCTPFPLLRSSPNLYHSVILSFYLSIILSFYHSIILSFYHSIRSSLYLPISISLSFCPGILASWHSTSYLLHPAKETTNPIPSPILFPGPSRHNKNPPSPSSPFPLRPANYELRTTNYELRTTNYELQELEELQELRTARITRTATCKNYKNYGSRISYKAQYCSMSCTSSPCLSAWLLILENDL